MTDDTWARVEAIFLDAIERPSEERAAFVAAACGDDAALRREVDSLVAAGDDAGDFLGASLPEVLDGLEDDRAVDGDVGARVGPYRLVELLGRGGVGAVYLAEREGGDFERRVAIKLIKRGMDTDDILRRFREERRVLAGLDHLNVARLIDGGATDDGRPYLVMEPVDGQPIDRFCAEHALSVTERLELFLKVCDAVATAHRALVVHRDLKPGNILVTDAGEPKLLDFGIAKVLGPGDAAGPDVTATGHRLMTPQYASPEQVRGDTITTASDVYALGVILYELLTGRVPYDLRDRPPSEHARIICEAEPERPSIAVAQERTVVAADATGDTATIDARRLRRRLTGDLDNIVLMALRKDPARRYASVDQLAGDIRRSLQGFPVTARIDTATYRMSRFVQRNRRIVFSGAAVALTLALGLTTTTLGLIQVRAERDAAETARDESEAVTVFLEEMMAAADPYEAGDDVSVRAVLDAAGLLIDDTQRPLVAARLHHVIGVSYMSLAAAAESEHHLTAARDIRSHLLGERHPDTLASAARLARLYWNMGRLDEAEALAAATHKTRVEVLGPDHLDTLESLNDLGRIHRRQRDSARAIEAHETVLAALKRTVGEDHSTVLTTMMDLGLAYQDVGRFDAAEPMLLHVFEQRDHDLGGDDPATLTAVHNLATFYNDLGRYAEAEPLLVRLAERRRTLLGPDHPHTLNTMNSLAVAYKGQGKLDAAEPIYVETLAARRRAIGDEHPHTLGSMNNLAQLYRRLDRFDEAEALFDEALRLVIASMGEDNSYALTLKVNLADTYLDRGRVEAAEALLAPAVATARTALPPDHWLTGQLLVLYGRSLTTLERYDDAEAALLEARDRLAASFGDDHSRTQGAVRALIAHYEEAQRPDDAARWRDGLGEAPR